MTSTPCDIVLLPNSEVADSSIELSRSLHEQGSLFSLSKLGPFPHISIYMFQMGTDNTSQVIEKLEDIAQSTQKLDLQPSKFFHETGYLDVEYEKTGAFTDLQASVVSAVNPLREGMRAKDIARMEGSEGVARENYEKYGWRSIGELFRPHLTFTRFESAEESEGIQLENLESYAGTGTRLGLFEMGDNGTAIREIATFRLEG